MLTALRAQVNAALADVPARRRPALRRPDAPDALVATDLPFLADRADVEAFIARMREDGWRIREAGGWLLLDGDVPAPDSPVPAALTGECGCCISLLLRHPADDAPCGDALRALVKAADAGPVPLERCCSALHADLAARLRLRQPLPGGLLPYLCFAHESARRKGT